MAYLYGIDSDEYKNARNGQIVMYTQIEMAVAAGILGSQAGAKLAQAYLNSNKISIEEIYQKAIKNNEFSYAELNDKGNLKGAISQKAAYDSLKEMYPESQGYKVYQKVKIFDGNNEISDVDCLIMKNEKIIDIYSVKSSKTGINNDDFYEEVIKKWKNSYKLQLDPLNKNELISYDLSDYKVIEVGPLDTNAEVKLPFSQQDLRDFADLIFGGRI